MSSSLFIKACRGEPLPRPPVWMMRQAGRYLPQYREVRAKVDFLTLCRTPELASQVTLQPVDLLGVDAAVIFSDILVILEAMGLPLHFGADQGPRINKPIRHKTDLQRLHPPAIERDLGYVGDAIRLTTAALKGRNIPVIGFAGAPFTLACYAVEGKTDREFKMTRKWMREDPEAFALLLEKLEDGVRQHLEFQIRSGAAAVQIFESWGGILGQETYRTFILPGMQRLVASLKPLGVPIIFYLNGSSPHLKSMLESQADVLSVDWRLPLSEVRRQVGPRPALQGNLDPTALYGSPKMVAEATRQMLADHPQPGLIANLGHGILPDVPVEHARVFVETVKGFKSSS